MSRITQQSTCIWTVDPLKIWSRFILLLLELKSVSVIAYLLREVAPLLLHPSKGCENSSISLKLDFIGRSFPGVGFLSNFSFSNSFVSHHVPIVFDDQWGWHWWLSSSEEMVILLELDLFGGLFRYIEFVSLNLLYAIQFQIWNSRCQGESLQIYLASFVSITIVGPKMVLWVQVKLFGGRLRGAEACMAL